MNDQGLTRRDILGTAVASGALAVASPMLAQIHARENWRPRDDGPTLRQRADAKHLLCGSAVNARQLGDPQLLDVLRQDCNILVPENELKFPVLKPTQDGPYNWGPAEAIYSFARANGMKMRGHNLLGWEGQPQWLKQLVPTLSAAKTGDLLTGYITDVASHWRGRLVQWDVVNEPISAQNQLLEKTFSAKLGEQSIDLAFQAVHAADPNVLLVLNHDFIQHENDWQVRQRAATLALLKRLVARGVPVQALGVESHMDTSLPFSPTNWRAFLDQVSDLGLKIMVTEFDVNDRGIKGDDAARDAGAADFAKRYLDIMLSYPNCPGLLSWGMSDRDTWLNRLADRRRGDGAPLRPDLRDANYRRKPLWDAVASAIDDARPRSA